MASSSTRPWERGFLGYVRRHPVLFLVFLSPGIPEYLSGSSPISALVANPPQFFLQLGLNLGLYGPGVLLIREAKLRWHKGWATVLLLGAAYGILEEGIALSTLFNPIAQPVGIQGFYGHWLGVSWIWTEGVILVHVLFSITIPILLLHLAIPSARGKPFLTGPKLRATAIILGVDVSVLFGFVTFGQKFWMGDTVLVGAVLAVLALVYLGRVAPADWPTRRSGPPPFGLLTTAFVGVFAYLGILLIEGMTGNTVAALTFVIVLAFEGVYAWWVFRFLKFPGNERHLLAFSAGAIVPIIPFGVVTQFPLEFVLIADAGIFLLYRNLFKMYPGLGQGAVAPSEGTLTPAASAGQDVILKYCTNCGSQTSPSVAYCRVCGAKVSSR